MPNELNTRPDGSERYVFGIFLAVQRNKTKRQNFDVWTGKKYMVDDKHMLQKPITALEVFSN